MDGRIRSKNEHAATIFIIYMIRAARLKIHCLTTELCHRAAPAAIHSGDASAHTLRAMKVGGVKYRLGVRTGLSETVGDLVMFLIDEEISQMWGILILFPNSPTSFMLFALLMVKL